MKTHIINTGDKVVLSGKEFLVYSMVLNQKTRDIEQFGKLVGVVSLGWDARLILNYIPPNLPPPDPHKGAQIFHLSALARAARNKQSVYVPSCSMRPMPATFQMNMTAAVVQQRIERGLFIYLPKVKAKKFCYEEDDE